MNYNDQSCGQEQGKSPHLMLAMAAIKASKTPHSCCNIVVYALVNCSKNIEQRKIPKGLELVGVYKV